MKTINSIEAFEKALMDHTTVCIVFSSDQCIDCLYLNQFITDVEQKFNTVKFFTIKRHQLPEVFTHYSIYGVPSLFVYQNTNLISTYIDKHRKTQAQIEAFLHQSLKKGVT